MNNFNRKLVSSIIISLIMGFTFGYMIMLIPEFNPKIGQLKGQIKELQSQILEQNNTIETLKSYLELKDKQISNLQVNVSNLSYHLNELQKNYTLLLQKYNDLNNSYSSLLNTLNIIDVKGLHRVENFTINSGETIRYEYDVGYGIIWIIELSLNIRHDGTRWECYISWRQGENGDLVSGCGITLSQVISKVSGIISTDIYDQGDSLLIKTSVNPEISYFSRTGIARLLKNPK